MGEITVFISYSHDSDEHREQVLALSERLRADGLKTLPDQYVNGAAPPRTAKARERPPGQEHDRRTQGNQPGSQGTRAHFAASDLGAAACFFEPPWSCLSAALTEADQAWLLNEAATRLQALGGLNEALEPMRVSAR